MKNIIQPFIFFIMVLKCLLTMGQKCPKPPVDRVAGSLILNDNGKIYDTDTIAKICLNSNVKVYSNNNLTNILYWFNYEGDSIPTKNGNNLLSGKFKFSKEGTFTLIQQGEIGGKKTYACKIIEVLGITLPAVVATSCNVKSLILEIPTVPDMKFDKYDILWGDGQSTTINKNITTVSHNYSSASTYYISFTGKRDNLSCSSSNIFSIKPDGIPPYIPPPSIRKAEFDETGVSLKLTTTTSSLNTNILQKEVGGSYKTLGQKCSFGSNQVNKINGLDSTQQYVYKLQVIDACNNKVESSEIYTINLKTKAENNKNLLNWTAYPTTITNYDILSNGGVIGLVTNNLTSSYSHQNTICGQKYCYQVKAKIGSIESVSQLKCVVGKNIKTLDPITEGLVSIDNKMVNLSWKLPTGISSDEITIVKSEGLQGQYKFLKKGNINQFSELFNENNSSQPCYQLSYTDKCNNLSSNSNAFCPVILTTNGKEMTWTKYERFTSPQYTMEVFDNSKTLLKTIMVNGLFSITPKSEDYTSQNLMFRVKTTASDGRISYSNIKALNFSSKILVPTAFTPNGDGVNDTFKVYTAFIKNYSLQIFDRWGNIIFTSLDSNEEWDGKINHLPLENGSFVYTINAEGYDGSQLQKSGIINIIF